MWFMLERVEVKKDILAEDKYKYLFSVELVNQLVLEGKPFRDAYVEVGRRIEKGEFEIPEKLSHTHEGSLGNLCNDEVKKRYEALHKVFRDQGALIETKYGDLLKLE
jgi:argininosuccinate lyase